MSVAAGCCVTCVPPSGATVAAGAVVAGAGASVGNGIGVSDGPGVLFVSANMERYKKKVQAITARAKMIPIAIFIPLLILHIPFPTMS